MKNCGLYKISVLFLTLFWLSCKNSIAFKTKDVYTRQICSAFYYDLLKKQVYTKLEIEPEFPGGMSQYTLFMNRNVKCSPEMIGSDKMQSSVGFTFIVDTDGKIKYPAFHGSVDTTEFSPLEKEIYRVLKLMPKWRPGICNGKAVAAEVKRSMVVCFEKE